MVANRDALTCPDPRIDDRPLDPTPSLLSFGEAIELVRQRLNASSGRAAAVVREALKSGALRIIRDDHVDPISGSLFAIVEADFLDWLNRQLSPTAITPEATRSNHIASEQDRLRLNCGAHRARLTICRIHRTVVKWPNG